MRYTYVRHDRTSRVQCQQVTAFGVALGARGELLCSSICMAMQHEAGLARRGRGGGGRRVQSCVI